MQNFGEGEVGVLGGFNVNSIYKIICSLSDLGGTRKDFAKRNLNKKLHRSLQSFLFTAF